MLLNILFTRSPQVYVEEPRRLPAPVTITYYKPPNNYSQSHTVQYFEKPNRWKVRKRQQYEAEPKTTPLCKWYRRRKALKELIAEHKKEEELLKKKRREEYERERMKELMEWEREREKARSLSTDSGFKWRKGRRSSSVPPAKKEKLYIKERSASAKPRAHSKTVAVKR